MFEEQLKDLYLSLNINNEKNFEQYLSEYNLSISEVKKNKYRNTLE